MGGKGVWEDGRVVGGRECGSSDSGRACECGRVGGGGRRECGSECGKGCEWVSVRGRGGMCIVGEGMW